jgi:membrane-associated phospholipid phosphatase
VPRSRPRAVGVLITSGGVSEQSAVLPRSLRRPAAVAVTLAALGFVVLAAHYAGGSTAGRFDTHIEGMVGALTPGKNRVLSAVVILGNPLPVATATLALSGICLMLGRYRLALLAVVGPGLTGVATTLFKPLIGRTLEGGFIYPSGHAGAATALGLIAALLLVNVLRPGPWVSAALLTAGAALTGGAMAVALVAGGFHYPTDTAGGFCMAIAVVVGTALLLERWAEGRSRTAALHISQP